MCESVYVSIICVFLCVSLLFNVDSHFKFCFSKIAKTESSQDMLLFDINMSIESSANELSNGDKAGKGKSKDSWLPLFSFTSVSASTNDFSTENKLGEGGFGPVYKVTFLCYYT